MDIQAKIEEIYQSKSKDGKPTGKNFISHIIRSYFPVAKSQRVIDVPAKPMKCAITGQKLFAVGELWNAMQQEGFMADFMKNIRYGLNPEVNEVAEHPFAKVANGRVIGITGEKTDTYLCEEAFKELFNWYASKILSGDSYINWLSKSMRTKAIIEIKKKKMAEINKQKKNDELELAKLPEKQKTTFGDLAAFQELHIKLKAQEENGTDKG